MIHALRPLEQAFHAYRNEGDPDRQDGLAQALVQACAQIGYDAEAIYRQYNSIDMARSGFRHYHYRLIRLNNGLYEIIQAKPQLGGIHQALNALQTLLADQEALYAELIDLRAPLSLYDLGLFKNFTGQQLPTIIQQLRQKDIHTLYLDELRYAMDSLFEGAKLPEPSYYHRDYLKKLFAALRHLAEDPRQKNWPARFVECLIRYNFNYMGFFNRWCEAQDRLFEQALGRDETQELFRRWNYTLHHYQSLPNSAYDIDNASLLDHMKVYVNSKRKAFKDWQRTAALNDTASLHTNLSSAELAIDFHYKYKLGFYPYANKREAAKAYAAAHLSKTGRHISPHTLEKFDQKALIPAAAGLRNRLRALVDSIKEDFKL